MRERLEELLQIKQICVKELKQAQENCERYTSNISALAEKLNENWQSTNNFLIEYDSFLTNITTIMDAARKFNLNLHLHNTKLSETEFVFSKPHQKTETKTANGHTERSKKAINNVYPAEEYDLISEACEDFVYPTLNLSDVYEVNDVIDGTITYIKNLKDFSFYVFDNSSKYRQTLFELTKTLELRQYHGMPSALEVFGCVLDNHIFRAVRSSTIYHDVEMNVDVIPCYILDTGEVLPLKSDCPMYVLTDSQKNIPALALPCKLKLNNNPFVAADKVEDKLRDMKYQKCQLKILEIENNTLHVQIMDDVEIVKDNGLEVQAINNDSLQVELKKLDKIQLTEEELNVLYEEPLTTTNAMKAVMGYDPQDDKRICRFYNPSTGGCFKGARCKLEHSLRQPDGWTKDILPTASIVDTHPITVFEPNSIINITPTFIGQLDRFFAQINDPCKTTTPILWNDDDIPSWKRLQKPPPMFEFVLARYIDGLWYRAKIMSHDDDYKMFKVFYVDYGNSQLVPLHSLASIDTSTAQLPFQAVLCRFETVNEKPSLAADERKNCIEILCEMILNKSMDVKVVSHYEDLFISFVDKKTYPLPDALVEMGYLELNENKVHL